MLNLSNKIFYLRFPSIELTNWVNKHEQYIQHQNLDFGHDVIELRVLGAMAPVKFAGRSKHGSIVFKEDAEKEALVFQLKFHDNIII